MDEKIEVGKVVAWDKVPSGAMARVKNSGIDGDGIGHVVRLADTGDWVEYGEGWQAFFHGWRWSPAPRTCEPSVTVIAMGLTGQETAADLRRLAEVYEVRETLTAAPALGPGFWRVSVKGEDVVGLGFPAHRNLAGCFKEQALNKVARRLHRAGWRPDMTAEDAARLLRASEEP